ncbi:MAG: cation-translocating P-type ATPase [Pirellulales bacterium]
MNGRSEPNAAWHSWSADECLTRLASDFDGLDAAEAERRRAVAGWNELASGPRISAWHILRAQFQNVLVLILIAAVLISAFLGHEIEAVAIGVIVLFAAGLGFLQEYRAERSMEALRRMAAPAATAIRGGEEVRVAARELVPGDVILLRAGDRVPADGRLLESFNLQVEEAALTGESTAVEKSIDSLSAESPPLGDRTCMVYGGTTATYGRGRAVVTAIGMNTEFGKVAQMLQTVETTLTPLQQNLDRVGSLLSRAALVIVAVIVAAGLLRGQPFVDMLIFGVALAVAVVPEALPAVVTISLAIGVQRMVRRNALIRRLPAVETLGSTSYICSDKTGTLTKDEMTVRQLVVGGQTFDVAGAGYEPVGRFERAGAVVDPPPAVKRLLSAAALASDAHVTLDKQTRQWEAKGDPTEAALVVAAAKAGLHKIDLDAQQPRIGEIPFTSESKRMTTLHRRDGGQVAYAKGAPEVLLAACTHRATASGADASGDEPLDEAGRLAILADSHAMAANALRVLAVAERSSASLDNAEQQLTFLGLCGMIDPPRTEAKEAIQKCRRAGVKVVMITGDHPVTARAIARELGILTTDRVVTGAELDGWSDAQLAEQVESIETYARVSPAHKLRVVTALQDKGHVAAMTGDGVNDAPALKKAAIGIAMGIAGTDVTKEAAAMTLTDDNFASIVAAVEEGRGIYGNIKKYLMYLLSANIGEIGLMGGASLLGLPLPLSAVQLLYINLATDGLPALALAVDPPARDLMEHPPRRSQSGIFTRPVVILMLAGGLWSTLANLALCIWARRAGYEENHAMTLTFLTLVLIEFFKAYNFRSDRDCALIRPFENKWLNLAIAWEIVLLAVVIYAPWFQPAFRTVPLDARDWTLALGVAASIFPVLEIAKWCERRGLFGPLD